MTAMPAVQTIPSPYCFCTTHDSTWTRMGAIASVRMPMVSDARVGDRQHGLLRRMTDCVGNRIRTGGKRGKKPEGEYPPAFPTGLSCVHPLASGERHLHEVLDVDAVGVDHDMAVGIRAKRLGFD